MVSAVAQAVQRLKAAAMAWARRPGKPTAAHGPAGTWGRRGRLQHQLAHDGWQVELSRHHPLIGMCGRTQDAGTA